MSKFNPKWTQGAWVHDSDGYSKGHVYVSGRLIAGCNGWSETKRTTEVHIENIANAQLCSAAPDMYEALELAREEIVDYINDLENECKLTRHEKHIKYVKGQLERIDAALEKARGEA